MFVTKPVKLTRGDFKRHHKEPMNDWVYRILEITNTKPIYLYGTDGDGNIIVSFDGEEKTLVETPESRLQAFMSWFFAEYHQICTMDEASVLVITDPGIQYFLLQRKDNLYPREAAHERYALIGGRAFADEDPKHTMWRELYEEIRNLELADQLASQMVSVGKLEEDDQSFLWHVYLAQAKSNEQFQEWAELFLKPQALAESTAAFLSRELFNRMAELEREQTGSYFFSGQHRLIRKAF